MRRRDIGRIKYRKALIDQFNEMNRIINEAKEEANRRWKAYIDNHHDDKLITDLTQLMMHRFLQRKSRYIPTFATRNLKPDDAHNSQMIKTPFDIDWDDTSEYPSTLYPIDVTGKVIYPYGRRRR